VGWRAAGRTSSYRRPRSLCRRFTGPVMWWVRPGRATGPTGRDWPIDGSDDAGIPASRLFVAACVTRHPSLALIRRAAVPRAIGCVG
jgi:hypothetical protein